jgi:hypothetical protein
VKKPGTGIPASRFRELIGRRTMRAIAAETMLTDADVDWREDEALRRAER